MQTLRHIVLVCVLTMSLLTSLMLSVILNLSLSVSPISPHVQLSLYSWISLLFSQGPPAHAASAGLLSNQILTVKVCSSTGRCSSSFIAITLVIFAFFLALFLKIWLHCFFVFFCSFVILHVNGKLNHRTLAALFCWGLAPRLFHAEIFSSKRFTDSLLLFSLTLLLYFLSFSAPLLTDGLSTLSSWLPHRSELTTRHSEGRAKTARTFQLLRSNSHCSHHHFSSSLSSPQLPLILLLTYGMCILGLDPTVSSYRSLDC